MSQNKLKLIASVEHREGGVILYANIGDWIWTCKARGNVKQWPFDLVEEFVRRNPERFSSDLLDVPKLEEVLKVL